MIIILTISVILLILLIITFIISLIACIKLSSECEKYDIYIEEKEGSNNDI